MADLTGAGLGHYFTDIETAQRNTNFEKGTSRSPSQDPSLLPGQEDDFHSTLHAFERSMIAGDLSVFCERRSKNARCYSLRSRRRIVI